MSQSSLYDPILEKINNIKDKILKIKEYTEIKEINNINYLENLSNFSEKINSINAMIEDLYDIYILNINSSILSNEDLNLQKNLLINKKVHDTFLPYMLYLQILLQNQN